MDDRSFHKILDYFNLSHPGYRKVRKGVKKRLLRHMQELACTTVDEYIATFSRDPRIEEECRLHLTVSISRFFRDKRLWEHLEHRVLPSMLSGKKNLFRVWSCGCARGEEAYSFKMVWDRLSWFHSNLPRLDLWATDIHPAYLDMAQKGEYGISSLKELPRHWIERYFDKVTGKQRYLLKRSLKEGVRFHRHDFVGQNPPEPGFEVVFLRNNLLTYFRSPEKDFALQAVLQVLVPGGLLITGSHEKLPAGSGTIKPWPDHPWIHVKNVGFNDACKY